jgi:hypothetical protein
MTSEPGKGLEFEIASGLKHAVCDGPVERAKPPYSMFACTVCKGLGGDPLVIPSREVVKA